VRKRQRLENVVANVARALGAERLVISSKTIFGHFHARIHLVQAAFPVQPTLLVWSYDESGSTRFRLTGKYPTGRENYRPLRKADGEPGITVSAGRDPESIATDVRRRLIPPYMELLKTAVSRVEEHDKELARRDAVIERLEEIQGVRRNPHSPDTFSYSRRHDLIDKGLVSGSGQLTPDRVSLELRRIPQEIACEVLELISRRLAG